MNAWLAKLELNLKNREVRRDLRDVDNLHKRMMMLVPDGLGDRARAHAGLLFRLEETDNVATALVQGRLPLDPSRLPTDYASYQVRDLSPMFAYLTKGRVVRYRITANASKRKAMGADAAKRGPIIALHGAAAEEWWRKRATQAGLQLVSVMSSPVGTASGKHIRHDFTRFDGVAVVEDAEALNAAVLDGIGRGKSYGGGLLSLAPGRLS